MKEGV